MPSIPTSPLEAPQAWETGVWRAMLPAPFALPPAAGPDAGPDDPATLRSCGVVRRSTLASWVDVLTAVAAAITREPEAMHPMRPDWFRAWMESTPAASAFQAMAILQAWHPAAWAACAPVPAAVIDNPRAATARITPAASGDVPGTAEPPEHGSVPAGPWTDLAADIERGDRMGSLAAALALLALPPDDLARVAMSLPRPVLQALPDLLGQATRPDPIIMVKALNDAFLSSSSPRRRADVLVAVALPSDPRPQSLVALLHQELRVNGRRPLSALQFWETILRHHPLPDDTPFERGGQGFDRSRTLAEALADLRTAAVSARQRYRSQRPGASAPRP